MRPIFLTYKSLNMRYRNILILFLFVYTLVAFGQKRPMTTDDGLELINLGNAAIHPEGGFVWYEKSELDWEGNKRKSSFWYLSSDGEETFPYLGEMGGTDIRFSPKGTS